ncbi:MAG TPA: alpha/beta hydrolase domain-containing protein [Vicinamibacterales bacterium]|nr:alpha/beta hydrolase domain-containing protein [Vicinamibacterales bacterium]
MTPDSMKKTMIVAMAAAIGVIVPVSVSGQGGGAPAQDPALPDKPVAVSVPTVSTEVKGPGSIFDSTPSLPPGNGLAQFGYEAREYFVSGTANKHPYKTRIVVRKPSDNTKFSGLVLTEAMHPSGNAHMFEFTSTYGMSSGHAAVEIVTAGFDVLVAHNRERYADLKVEQDQVSEILAQVGALIKGNRNDGPMAELSPRKMVLAGTSATAAVLIRYLPAHMVYRTPDMKTIYDGFLPTSTGATVRQVDVPLIQIPTMTEVGTGNVTARQDGDASGDQFRLYEFAGMAHVDSRDSVRFQPDPCKFPVSRFPLQAYMSVALHHLFEWVDKGKVPPRAERILLDRNVTNDGSLMALDDHGNSRGGIRNPYVDVPTTKLGVRNEAAEPPIPKPSAWIAARGPAAATQMCGLAGYQMPLMQGELKKLYGSKNIYQDRVKRRLDELERAGWSLPVYRETILADAARVEF